MRRFAAVALVCLSGAAVGAGDAGRGAQLFRQCAACHSTQPGEHMTGPSLARLLGHKAGTNDGFARYSEALKRSGVTWSEETSTGGRSDTKRTATTKVRRKEAVTWLTR